MQCDPDDDFLAGEEVKRNVAPSTPAMRHGTKRKTAHDDDDDDVGPSIRGFRQMEEDYGNYQYRHQRTASEESPTPAPPLPKRTKLSAVADVMVRHDANFRPHVHPVHRFRVLQCLQREASKHNNLPIPEYASQTENLIYAAFYHDPLRYNNKCTQIIYNVRRNGALLVKYTPDVLIALDDRTLTEGTEMEGRRLKYEADVAASKKLISIDKVVFSGNAMPAAGTGVRLRCSKCKNKDTQVKVTPLQTAGGDESMKLYCQCLNPACKHHWSMS